MLHVYQDFNRECFVLNLIVKVLSDTTYNHESLTCNIKTLHVNLWRIVTLMIHLWIEN